MRRLKKRLLILAAVITAAFLLMLIFRGDEESSDLLKIVSYPYDTLSRIISSSSAHMSSLISTEEENERLRRELSALLTEKQGYSELVLENRRLTELLNLKAQLSSGGIAAKIVGRGYNRFSNILIIDKGRNHGIVKDMPVITPKGLAGKVLSVRNEYADIILLKDSSFSVAVRLRDSRHEGVLSGNGQWYCILKYVPTEQNVQPGEEIITSGLDGIFPPGIPVGRVVKSQTEGVEFFQHIEVAPFQSSSTLEEVLVITRTSELREQRNISGSNVGERSPRQQ